MVSVIDLKDWKTIRQIQTPGPGFFMRSHENSRYAFVDSVTGREHKDTLKEMKCIPASKPVGKYNVWNKITRSEGTSH